MSFAWRNWTATMMLGLSLTAQPLMAQTKSTMNPHLDAYARQIGQNSSNQTTPRFDNIDLLRKAIGSLPADQQASAPLVAFGVPALSSIKRMPHTLPTDGVAGRMIPAVAARGEYSPLSFVVAPLTNIDKLEVRASALVSGQNRIDASRVDLKVIKVWYQTATSWHSYFADPTSRVLIPELLLNDENLIRVDHQTQDNFLRVDYPEGSKYVWISAPISVDDGKFNHAVEPVADSDKLLPVKLVAGESKQFWVTIHVPNDAAQGLYEGSIELLADGKTVTRLPLSIRVLPFELPLPRTYYDLDKPFMSLVYNHTDVSYHLDKNGGNLEQAIAKSRAELKNLREHNIFNHMMSGRRELTPNNEKSLVLDFQLIREAGFVEPIFNAFSASGSVFYPKERNPLRYQRYLDDARRVLELSQKILGHSNLYFFGFDEPGMTVLLAQQDGWRDLQKLGAKIYSTSKESHYYAVGFSENIANYHGDPTRDKSTKWTMLGHQLMNYAAPHTGPENPEFNRRFHGLQLYKAMYSGPGNYKYYDQHKPWNDFASTQYRGFNLVYPTKTGVIDTMAWEGFRAALDDVRYATLLKMLAEEAFKSDNVDTVMAAKKAMIWFEETNEMTSDLDTFRLEMVNYILDLRERLGKAGA